MTNVAVGQIWIDTDSRLRKSRAVRKLRIERVTEDVAFVRNVETNRVGRISLERFKPTSTGYRLET
jgi:hypothetical protein